MSENVSPDGTFPTFPLALAVDTESVTNDKLCTSATPSLGWLGKLINAVGYLLARSPQVFNISTDGAGNIATNRRTPGIDGTTQLFSSIALSTVSITCTFTTALASEKDAAYFVGNHFTPTGDRFPYIYSATTTAVVIRTWDISGGADVDMAADATELALLVFPRLAGYT